MFHYFIFLTFSLISYFLIYLHPVFSRSDVVREIQSSTGDTRGSWRNLVYCLDNHYVNGFNQRVDCNNYGVNVFILYCASLDNSQSYSIISYDDSGGSWQTNQYCNFGDFMQSYFVSKNGCTSWSNLDFFGISYCVKEISLSDVRMKCITGTNDLSPGGGCHNDWTGLASCTTGEAICGYQIRFEDGGGVRASDSIFKCCCLNGYFLYTDSSNGQKTVITH